uniref:RNA-directed DNA polymerase, eukaryota n=1 Tax=Tanacetum cinerariifolium TaxID=118510 RepID=A0A699H3W7_TANCI|nr:hypothetical protein [Tanacetum cinerariifolium]
MNFFYNKCQKYRLDPSYEDDVATDDGVMAKEMRAEDVDLVGDFNVILDPSERSAGSSYFTAGIEDFRDCLGEIRVEDLCMPGLKFTWNKSPGRIDGLLKKLDIVMCNGAFVEQFVNSNAGFLPFVTSDHTPAVVKIPKPLKKLKFSQGDLAKKVAESRHELERVQTMMSMLKQRAKVSWLSEGDANTKFFHKTVKGNLNRNRIENVEDMEGVVFSCQLMRDQFVKHFCSVFGEAKRVKPISDPAGEAQVMIRPVSREEIKLVIFAMNDDNAPGPDGFLSKFFKASRSVIGDEVCIDIGDFFKNGRL